MYLGIDVGGTSLKAGLVSENGHIVAQEHVMVEYGNEDFHHYLAQNMAYLTKKLLEKNGLTISDIPYVGAGMPGSVDDENGIFLFAPNMPIHEAPVRKDFQEYLDIPLRLGNDANCAALGEYVAGAGKQYNSLVLLTLGTGVGTGIILNDKMWTGCNGAGAEGGHITLNTNGLQCGCGRKGCLETYASASGLIRLTIDKMLTYKDSGLWAAADGSLDKVEGSTVFKAVRAGDSKAQEVLDDYIDVLAEGILDLTNLLQPDVVVIGGGISNADDDLLLEPLRKRVAGRDMAKYSSPKTKIVKSSLGSNAGIVGAAFLGAESLKQIS